MATPQKPTTSTTMHTEHAPIKKEYDIWTNVAKAKLEGVMFHDAMTDLCELYSLHGFSAMQKYQFYDELESFREIKAEIIEHYKKVPDIDIKEEPEEIEQIEEMYEHQAIPEQEEEIIEMGKKILYMYLDWEEDTCKDMKELKSEIKDGRGEMKKLVREVEEEIEEIEEIMEDLESHGWDYCYFMRMQDYLCRVYKRKLKDAL